MTGTPFLDETSDKDTSKVKIDKWNQSADKYEDNTRTGNSTEMYDYGNSSMITDRTRVYKGGSWKDRAYWLNPGTRRFQIKTKPLTILDLDVQWTELELQKAILVKIKEEVSIMKKKTITH